MSQRFQQFYGPEGFKGEGLGVEKYFSFPYKKGSGEEPKEDLCPRSKIKRPRIESPGARNANI